MSTTDNAFSATLEPIDTPKTTLKQRWWHIMDNWKVGIVPLPLFLLAGGLIALDCLGGKLPSDIVVMVATLAFFGFACGEFGKRLPVLGNSVRRRSAPPLFLPRWSTMVCCLTWLLNPRPNSINPLTFSISISAASLSAAS